MNVFVEKVSLHSSLKGYDGEKAAQNLASKLEGRAFDVYMRLPTADKKDASKIKSELLKEFESGNVDREAAIVELNNRRRKSDESPQTFAYKLISLVKLAYPTFDDSNQKTIAKDYFLKGLHQKMQIALKSLPNFTEIDVDKLATETMRLQLAGIDSFAAGKTHECMSVESPSMVDAIAEKVIEKLRNSTIADHGADDGGKQESLAANFVSNQWRGYPRRGKQIDSLKNRIIREQQPNKTAVPHRVGENAVHARAQTILSGNALTAIARLVETKAMMLGTHFALNIND